MSDPFEGNVAGTDINFDLEQDVGDDKIIVTIYGRKGEGKTAIALAFEGSMAVLSFDNKTARIHKSMYPGKDVRIWNAVKYWNKTPAHITKTAAVTVEYVDKILSRIAANPPDWIVVDAMELLNQVAEMNMRYAHDLSPTEGFSNRNWWKERKMTIEHIHSRAKSIAKRGVIYTTFSSIQQIIRNGEVVDTKEVPNWIGIVMEETDVVIKAYSDISASGTHFIAQIDSNKVPVEYPDMVTGRIIDVTDDTSKLFKGRTTPKKKDIPISNDTKPTKSPQNSDNNKEEEVVDIDLFFT